MSCKRSAHLATIGVRPIVKGALTGINALLQRNASAREELGPVKRFVNQPRSFGFASSVTSCSAGSCVNKVAELVDERQQASIQKLHYLREGHI